MWSNEKISYLFLTSTSWFSTHQVIVLKTLFINNINNSFVEKLNLANSRYYEQLDKAAEKENVGYLREILEYKLVNLLLRPGDNHV